MEAMIDSALSRTQRSSFKVYEKTSHFSPQ